MGRAVVKKPEDASSNLPRANEYILVFHISERYTHLKNYVWYILAHTLLMNGFFRQNNLCPYMVYNSPLPPNFVCQLVTSETKNKQFKIHSTENVILSDIQSLLLKIL